MTLRKTALTVLAALTLSACASTSSGPVKALPPEFVGTAIEAAFADTIAEECRSLRYNQAHEDKVLNAYAVRLAAAGYTQRDLIAGAKRMERDPALQRKVVQMIMDRKINVLDERTWCAAGHREKAKRTKIGRYLM